MKKLNFKKLFLSIALLSSLSAFSQNIVSTQNTSGDGFCDGMAILNYTPNPGSWYWQGNNGQMLQQGGDTLANLCFGAYILVVNDSTSTNTYTFFIDSTNNSNPCSNYSFTLSSSTTVSGSNMCDGSASIHMNGNTFQSYNTSQLGVNVTQTNGVIYIDGICDGLFHITFVNNGCSSSVSCDVTYNDSTNTGDCNSLVTTHNTSNTTTDVTCDGSILLTSSGGTAPYSYQYSANGISNTNSTGQILDLCAGTYTIITFDANGCAFTSIATVLSDSAASPCSNLVVTALTQQNVSGPNVCDGVIWAAASGGTAPYQFSFNNSSYTDSLFTEACEGSVVVTVLDANGCSSSTQVYVGSDSTNTGCSGFYAEITSVNNTTTPSLCNGSLQVVSYGGVAPYSYTYPYNGVYVTDTIGYISNLCEGTFTITVNDANGCTYNVYASIFSDSINVACNGFYAEITNVSEPSNMSLCNGTVTIEAFGGTAPYTYINTNGNLSNGGVFDNLCVGTNVFIAQDATGCSFTISTSLYSADSLNSGGLYGIVSTQNVSETDVCDGVAFVSMQSGTAPFTFTNSTGITNSTGYFEGLCEGVQTVVVTDANGLTSSISYLISGPTNSSNGGNPNGNTTVIDSLYSGLLENCDIDYATVDTVLIESYTVYGQDSILVVWAVYQANDTLYITENYNITNGAGVYQVVLTVYCPGRIEGNYWYASAFVNTSSLSVDDFENSNEPEISQIYGQDAILVNLPESASFEWEIVDMTGRVIQQGREDAAKLHLIMMTSISSGHYVFKFMQAETHVTKTIIR